MSCPMQSSQCRVRNVSHEKPVENHNSGLKIRSGFHILSIPRITDQREERQSINKLFSV